MNDYQSMVGQKFHKLTLTKYLKTENGIAWCEFICECGNTTTIRFSSVKYGGTKGCGKCFVQVDLTDQKVGSLTVLGISHCKDEKRYWWCRCDCGIEKAFTTGQLRTLKSCGSSVHISGALSHRWKGCGDLSGHYWRVLKGGAIKRGLVFDIDMKYAWNLFELQNGKCALCGVALEFTHSYQNKHKDVEQTASLDRIDNNVGYVVGNVQWVHKILNQMKNSHTQNGFIKWCHLVAKANPMFEIVTQMPAEPLRC